MARGKLRQEVQDTLDESPIIVGGPSVFTQINYRRLLALLCQENERLRRNSRSDLCTHIRALAAGVRKI